jgi:hypothetical protein
MAAPRLESWAWHFTRINTDFVWRFIPNNLFAYSGWSCIVLSRKYLLIPCFLSVICNFFNGVDQNPRWRQIRLSEMVVCQWRQIISIIDHRRHSKALKLADLEVINFSCMQSVI